MVRGQNFMLGALFAMSLLMGTSVAQNFDFFYFVVQWPGSYCDLSTACCYPNSGKPPSDFTIHGLWPNYDDGTYPSNCDSSDPFDKSKIQSLIPTMNTIWGSLSCPSSDSTSFWSHEWSKHGTCSGFVEYNYFDNTVNLYGDIDLMSSLRQAGITPNGGKYSITSIQNALSTALQGHLPGVECNNDKSGRNQLYQVYICVNTDGQSLIDCPVFPNGKCQSSVYWQSF